MLLKKRKDADTNNIDIPRATQVVFKNCAPFKKCRTEINETFVDETEHTNIAMPMYNLISITIIILILQVVYGNLKEMK